MHMEIFNVENLAEGKIMERKKYSIIEEKYRRDCNC